MTTRFATGLTTALLFLAACGTDHSTATAPHPPRDANLAKGGGGSTVYTYALSGDIATPVGLGGTTSQPTRSPFQNLSVSGVTVTLGAPSGDISACRTGTATYSADFGANAGMTAVGTFTIAKTGTLSFLGTQTGGTAQIQFSVGDATGGPVQTSGAGGSYTYAYTDARLFFGGNSTYFDGLYRCVNISVTATP